MWESDVAHYGSTLWLGPLFLVGYLLLVGWMMNAPLTQWGARRIKRRLAREQRRHELSDERLGAALEHIRAQAAAAPPSRIPRWSPPEGE